MLDMSTKAISFPCLVKEDAGSHLSHPTRERPFALYTIDWEQFDQKKEDDFYKWIAQYHPTSKGQYIEGIPQKYNEIFSNLVFGLDEEHLNEIHHCIRMAYVEWSRKRHFDTVISEICSEPAISYIYVAFRLLCDNIFDVHKKEFVYGRWVEDASYHVLLYKFWHRQTGRGILWNRSKMERIEWLANDCPSVSHQNKEQLKNLITDMKAHYKLIDDNIVRIVNAKRIFQRHQSNK